MKDSLKEDKKVNFRKIIVFIGIFITIYFILLSSMVTKKYNLKEDDIAKVSIKATREVEDKLATQKLLEQAAQSVNPKYSKKTEVKDEVITYINKLFSAVVSIKDDASIKDDKDKMRKLRLQIDNLPLSDEKALELMRLEKKDVLELQEFLKDTMSGIYDNTKIAENDPEDLNKAKEIIQIKTQASKLNNVSKGLAISIGYSQIKPNFILDKEKTEELIKEAQKKVAPIMIKKDQIIVKEGEPITSNQIEILKSLQLLNNNVLFEWYIYISLAVFVILVLSIQWFYIKIKSRETYNDVAKMLMIGVVTCISLLLARGLRAYPFFIPLACAPMLISILVNKSISLVVNVLNCILISAAVGFNLDVTLLAIINAIVGATILNKVQQRNDIIYSALYLSVIDVLLTFSSGFLLTNSTVLVIQKSAFSFAGGILSGVLTIGLLPFFESTFGIVTTIKLLELSNPNHPLLKKLLMEAPGTYHHSVLVGNLAEVAAEEVGGNPVLARVAAYYHDVGKLKRPLFFKENQMNIQNPHNKITPNLSTFIIISHVKDGVELAKEYGVPQVIRNIIEQHHGTTLVKYFYLTVKNSSDKPEEVREEEFRYSGPIPKTKEAAIMMLADSVEASVRSITEPTKGKIEKMVNDIIKDRLNEGQLDDCDLTLKDLEKIRKAFLKVLNGIYHERIEYPKDKWELKKSEEK